MTASARLNWLHPPFDNVKARQAMLYLIDQKAILNATFGNPKYYNPCPSLFGYGTPMANDANTDWFKEAPNLAKAKQLFQEAGYKGEKVVVLQATDFAFMNNSAQLIAGWLQKIGVNAELAADGLGRGDHPPRQQKPDDQGGWNIFITYGGGYDFADPIDADRAGGQRQEGLVRLAGERRLRGSCAPSGPRPDSWRSSRRSPRRCRPLAWDFVPMVMLRPVDAARRDAQEHRRLPRPIPTSSRSGMSTKT